MGCCSTKSNQIGGIVIPEQETAIFQAELQHPFSQKRPNQLLKPLSKFQNDLTKKAFVQFCIQTEIPASQFEKGSRFYNFRTSLSKAGKISIELLRTSVVLLSHAEFHQKLTCLLDLQSQEPSLKKRLEFILNRMTKVSISILPRIARLPHNKISLYINRLQQNSARFKENFLCFFSVSLSSIDKIFQVFQRYPQLQKVCWSSGIRLMILQEDLKIAPAKRNPNQIETEEDEIIRSNLSAIEEEKEEDSLENEGRSQQEYSKEVERVETEKGELVEKEEENYLIEVRLNGEESGILAIPPYQDYVSAIQEFAQKNKMTSRQKRRLVQGINLS